MPSHRSEEHTSELQSHSHLVCRLLLEKKNNTDAVRTPNGVTIPPPVRHAALAPPRVRSADVPRRPLYSRPRTREHTALFFFNDPATTEIYPLSLHDALPI